MTRPPPLDFEASQSPVEVVSNRRSCRPFSFRALLGGWRDQVSYIFRLRKAGFTFEVLAPGKILARRNDVRLIVRVGRGDDLGHLEELYCRGQYGRDFADQTVIDVGMSTAESSVFFALAGACRVIGVEPDPEAFHLAIENIKLNRVEGIVRPLNLAVAGTTGEATLRISSRHPNANSLTPSASVQTYFRFDRTLEVRTISLPELIRSESLERVDLLKLDCEGAEYDIVRSLDATSAERIHHAVVEFHDGVQDLARDLTARGFEVGVRNDTTHIGVLTASRADHVR